MEGNRATDASEHQPQTDAGIETATSSPASSAFTPYDPTSSLGILDHEFSGFAT